jgi:hypothetical protein
MAEQYDSLGEKTKQVDIAMKYTRGDIIKAKDMAAGQYMDVMVLKGKFLVDKKGQSGAFLAFFNYIQEYISNVTAITSNKPILFEKTRIFDDWKTLYKDHQALKEGADMVDSQNFTYFLIDSFVGYDVFPDVQERNLDDLTRTVTEIIAKSFNVNSVKCQIEIEPASSLALELAGVKIDLPGTDAQDAAQAPAGDDRISQIESEAKYVIEGTALVAPVRGKNVNDLAPGDKIKVMLTGKDAVSEKILKLLNAYDGEGVRQPITGRIKARVPVDKGATFLYAFVAKGVLAKIFEEENVKILTDLPQEEVTRGAMGMENKILYIMAVVVGLIILCWLILNQIL